jgi:hypothetical protein
LSKIESFEAVPNIKNNKNDIKGFNHKKLHEISTIAKFLEKDIP